LSFVERFVVGIDYEVMENDACNYDALGKRLVVCGPQA